MTAPVYIHGRSDVGRVREKNEDAFRIATLGDGSRLLVVCDGMGGHEGGGAASAAASEAIVRSVSSASGDPRRLLYDALIEANAAVHAAAGQLGLPEMGTTAVVGWIRGSECFVALAGDSRLYHFRQGTLAERTRDHTRVEKLVQAGELDPAAAAARPDAHVLVQALGGAVATEALRPEVWADPIELAPGDVLLLCSDGLYDAVPDPELFSAMDGLDYQAVPDRLVDLANARGGNDNVTAVVAVIGQPEVASGMPRPEKRAGSEEAKPAPAPPSPQPAARAPIAVLRAVAARPWLRMLAAVVLALAVGVFGGWWVWGRPGGRP